MQLLPLVLGLVTAFSVTGGILRLRARNRKEVVGAIATPMDCLQAGDFEGALSAIEPLRERGMEVEYLYLRGGALKQLGRFEEAESTCLRCIALAEQAQMKVYGRSAGDGIKDMERLIRISSSASETLGCVYMEQARYDEAIKALEASLRDSPERSSPRRDIAEVYLRQVNVSEALKFAELAVTTAKEEKFASKAASDLTLAENLATLAWASAMAGVDSAEVERLIDEGINLAPREYPTVAAQVLVYGAYAYEKMSDLVKARECFNLAAAKDANGLAGRAARKALASRVA